MEKPAEPDHHSHRLHSHHDQSCDEDCHHNLHHHNDDEDHHHHRYIPLHALIMEGRGQVKVGEVSEWFEEQVEEVAVVAP